MTENEPGLPDHLTEGGLRGDEEELTAKLRNTPRKIPYHRVKPPADVPYTEYTFVQRRAVILQRIERVGHPAALNQTYAEMGEEFDVDPSMIHKDMSVLSDYMAENVERDHVSIMDSVFRGTVLELMESDENEDKAEAARIGREWFEWLADMGAIERVADKVDVRQAVFSAGETGSYRVIEDDEAAELGIEFVESEVEDP